MAANDSAGGRMAPRLTTLCYIERDGCYLVIHRNRKENDENGDKLILAVFIRISITSFISFTTSG